MKVWTVANLKGGVGKTTTALTLGGLAAGHGYKVILVDLDPHHSLSQYFLRDQTVAKHTSFDFFENESISPFTIKQSLHETKEDNLYLIPASLALASIDRQPVGKDGAGLKVRDAIQHASAIADLVIVDAPPMAGVLMVNAIMACQQLIVPVQTDYLGVQGLRQLLTTLELISDIGYEKTWEELLVPTLFDRRTHASQVALDDLRAEYGDRVWNSQIATDTKFREASAIGELPHRLTMECSGVNAYRLLLDTLLTRSNIENKDLAKRDSNASA